MGTVKIAINGFGRIGRLLFRALADANQFEVVAINGLVAPTELLHLLKYDTAQGRFSHNKDIAISGSDLVFKGKTIKILREADPTRIDWSALGAEVILECSGHFTSLEKAQLHIQSGAKKVLISAPGSGNMKTIVFGVNHTILDANDAVFSCASCTTNCLAPMAQALQHKYGIVLGFMTTIHAYTNDQNTQDGFHPKGDLRRARAAAVNIVPSSTGAAKAIGLVIPELKGKLEGVAQRVPTLTGSLTELVTVPEKKVSDAREVNQAMKAAANEAFGYTEDLIVSSDVIGMSYGSLLDATQTKVLSVGAQQMVKTVAWYDNEMSYVYQMVRTLRYFSKFLA